MNIREHPLAWRWTDPKYTVLPDDVLAQMQPIEQQEAERLFQQSLHFLATDSPSSREFPDIVRHSADVAVEAVRHWLREQQPDMSTTVFVSWQQDVALRTTWEVFTAHWDDFCYPASDEVLIWPESGGWALLYHHEQEFQFGRRPAA